VCINSISECSAANGDTVVKGHVLNYPVNGNINRMGVKMEPCLTPEVVEILDDSFCPTVIHTHTGIFMSGSDQMEYDVRHPFAAKCFSEGSAVDGVSASTVQS